MFKRSRKKKNLNQMLEDFMKESGKKNKHLRERNDKKRGVKKRVKRQQKVERDEE